MFKIYHTEHEIYPGLLNLEYSIQKRPKNNASLKETTHLEVILQVILFIKR